MVQPGLAPASFRRTHDRSVLDSFQHVRFAPRFLKRESPFESILNPFGILFEFKERLKVVERLQRLQPFSNMRPAVGSSEMPCLGIE